MKHVSSTLAWLMTFVFMSGCAGLVERNEIVVTEVAVFHNLDPTRGATTYSVVPFKGQDSNLEYEHYHDLVRKQLSIYGYEEVALDAQPNVVVSFSYTIDTGSDQNDCIHIIDQTGMPEFSKYGALSMHADRAKRSGTEIYTPICAPADSQRTMRREYNRDLKVYIVDASSLQSDELEVLYEGSAKSRGSSSQLPEVMPAMIDALFKGFPGKSGSTRKEQSTIKLSKAS